MEVEWDDTKRKTNLAKHRVDFERAAAIFAGPVATFEDDRFDYGEVRRISIGFVEQVCYVVVHTERDGVLRIISARLGGRHDQARYHAYFA